MSSKVSSLSALLGALNRIAPPSLAESWDNVGLQVGHPDQPVQKVLVALEISDAVIEEARDLGVQAIVTHHPLIFGGLKSLNESHTTARFVAELIRERIGLLTAHTNFDSVPNGTNGEIADRLELTNRKFLFPVTPRSTNVKFVVFVPTSHVDAVIQAIASSGAGVIGNYTACTFRSPGTGTFQPGDGASPYAGEIGKFEEATDEVRLEAVCPRSKLVYLITNVIEAHPYEEVAYDVYSLEPNADPQYGLGLIGKLPEAVSLEEFATQCCERFPNALPGIVGDKNKTIKRVAICSGAGGDAVRKWRVGMADVLVTGEMTHHQAAELRDRGVAAVLLGHFESEAIACQRMADLLMAETKSLSIEFHVSKKELSPIWR